MKIYFSEKAKIQAEAMEKRPLPTGMAEFTEWATRIINKAELKADSDSQLYVLANAIMNMSPTVAFEADIYFINLLRKYAANQIADAVRKELYQTAKQKETDGKVLEIKKL